MSNGLHSDEKNVPSSASTWDQYDFDDKLYHPFLGRLASDFGITKRDEIGGGLSGARTSSVRIDGSKTVKIGEYILKVCLSKDADQEIQKHREAKESPILRRYVPRLITTREYPDLTLSGILYQVAGGGQLMWTTLQKSLALNHYPLRQIEELARVMLRWNFESTPVSVSNFESDPASRSNLLETILEGIRIENIQSLITKLQGIVNYPERPRLDLTNLKVWRYNPVHFLLSQEVPPLLRQMQHLIPMGMLHRDLHPGNVIVPVDSGSAQSFHIIDFAASRPGNAFFDLAYLELSILLNSFNGFHSIAELKSWWELEEYLISEPLPRLDRFHGVTEGLWRVLPIRRALARKMKQDNFQDDYWISYLAASVEAGLDLARKIHRRSRQRVALLTAVSRFHYLVEALKAIEKPPDGPQAQATIYWPGEEPPLPPREVGAQRVSIPETVTSPSISKEKTKLEFVWPGEITRRAALYDPWMITDQILSTLTGESDQGVLLVGERKFGKSSFFNSIGGFFSKKEGTLTGVRLDTLGYHHTIHSFATQLRAKLCRRVGVEYSPTEHDFLERDFDIGSFLSTCQSVIDHRDDLRFVICIDEIDGTLTNATTAEDGQAILRLLSCLLTDPDLPFRLLITATDKEVLRHYLGGADFLDNLGTWKIPLCSEAEMRELIDCFDVAVTFEKNALSQIFSYSGGQIYFIKLAVNLAIKASVAQAGGINGKKTVSAQMVDDLMHAVIEPNATTPFTIRSIHDDVFFTMKNIYPKFFSQEEQGFMQALAEAGGILQAPSLQTSQTQLASIANLLYERGYLSKLATGESEEYSWRIGLWQVFLVHRYRLNNGRNREKH